MATTHVTKEPVMLEGFQAILKVGDYGKFKLEALLPKDMIDSLEDEREGLLDWARSKAKNPKRVTVKPEPWEELDSRPEVYKTRFSWKEDQPVPIVDTEGTAVTDKETPIYSGSTVKLAFTQKPYILPAGDIGTSLKLKAIQLVSLNSGAGVVDTGDLDADEAQALFGKTKGFKVESPSPTADPNKEEDEDC